MTLDEAEVKLRAAIDAGNADAIRAAYVDVERLTPVRPQVTLLGAALYYAEVGLRVFPLRPGTKIPFAGSNGCLGATTNAELIRDWWGDDPDANIGIATGHKVDVVDIDGAPGQKSRVDNWEEIFSKVDADNVAKVLTPRPGGMHIYVPANGQGNSAAILPGVDIRGAGGYVLAPPSVLIEGLCKPTDTPGTYRFLGTPRFNF